ncbi:MAG: 4-aminobutyrate aminotransferase [Chloroflexota bacterium]|jgi:4-aminobutyrate aminotransferase|nr:4-aminobutyrate aminotransferase [Chloroflexota bacterium]
MAVESPVKTDTERLLKLRDGVAPVWSRYTDLVVERGEGSWLTMIDGTRYLDYSSGIGVTNTGHSHPRVAAAIAEQAAKVIHAQQNIVYHQPGLELHARLPRLFPAPADPADPYALFLANSGAEAIEASVKLAKAATRRPIVVAFRGGFHGRTHATMALTSSGVRIRGHYEPLMGGVHFVPFPDPLRQGGGSSTVALEKTMAAIDELFATLCYPDDVAAFLVEPILGEGGYVIPDDGFLRSLRSLADQHGIMLIADEVQTGYGRTGRMFASEWTGARPDILVIAKGIASGMPLSGIMARRSLMDKFTAGTHGGTYGGNAVSCAAALATLDVIEDEGLVANAEKMGARLLAGLTAAASGKPNVAQVRGRGLMAAIEFAEPETLKPRPDMTKKLLAGALERHLMLLSCGTYSQAVRIIPPLVTTESEIDQAVATIGEVLGSIH